MRRARSTRVRSQPMAGASAKQGNQRRSARPRSTGTSYRRGPGPQYTSSIRAPTARPPPSSNTTTIQPLKARGCRSRDKGSQHRITFWEPAAHPPARPREERSAPPTRSRAGGRRQRPTVPPQIRAGSSSGIPRTVPRRIRRRTHYWCQPRAATETCKPLLAQEGPWHLSNSRRAKPQPTGRRSARTTTSSLDFSISFLEGRSLLSPTQSSPKTSSKA